MLFKVPGSRDELRPTLNIELSMYTYCLRSPGLGPPSTLVRESCRLDDEAGKI